MRSFLVDHDKGWDTPNRLVREIVLAGLGESEHRSCHSLAANHYTRHFEARRIEDRGGLGGHFVEARYHLGRARLAERRAPPRLVIRGAKPGTGDALRKQLIATAGRSELRTEPLGTGKKTTARVASPRSCACGRVFCGDRAGGDRRVSELL